MITARLVRILDDGEEQIVGAMAIEVSNLGAAVSPGGELVAAALRLADPVDLNFDRLVEVHTSGRPTSFAIEPLGGDPGWRGRFFVDTINRCADTRVCELTLCGDGTPVTHAPGEAAGDE